MPIRSNAAISAKKNVFVGHRLSLALHDMVVPADGRPDGSAADEGTTAADGGTNSTRAVKLSGATDNEVSVTAFVQFSVTSYSYLLRAVLR